MGGRNGDTWRTRREQSPGLIPANGAAIDAGSMRPAARERIRAYVTAGVQTTLRAWPLLLLRHQEVKNFANGMGCYKASDETALAHATLVAAHCGRRGRAGRIGG